MDGQGDYYIPPFRDYKLFFCKTRLFYLLLVSVNGLDLLLSIEAFKYTRV